MVERRVELRQRLEVQIEQHWETVAGQNRELAAQLLQTASNEARDAYRAARPKLRAFDKDLEKKNPVDAVLKKFDAKVADVQHETKPEVRKALVQQGPYCGIRSRIQGRLNDVILRDA